MNSQIVFAGGREPAHFLQPTPRAVEPHSHAQLWQWLDEQVQQWMPHDVFLVGWGDFERCTMDYDIVSAPGRSADFSGASVKLLLRYLHDCWMAARRVPLEVSLASCHAALTSRALAGLHTALVHGVTEPMPGHERMFAALSARPIAPNFNRDSLQLLLPLLDSALHGHRADDGEAMPSRAAAMRPDPANSGLSEREREIMHWVALGKTNPEIGCILGISEFTVKNHLKSIFAKLDVSNRAQAAAKVARRQAYA